MPRWAAQQPQRALTEISQWRCSHYRIGAAPAQQTEQIEATFGQPPDFSAFLMYDMRPPKA